MWYVVYRQLKQGKEEIHTVGCWTREAAEETARLIRSGAQVSELKACVVFPESPNQEDIDE